MSSIPKKGARTTSVPKRGKGREFAEEASSAREGLHVFLMRRIPWKGKVMSAVGKKKGREFLCLTIAKDLLLKKGRGVAKARRGRKGG